MSIDVMEQMRGAFRAEALDLLIELDSALLAQEAESGDSTLVHRIFRAIHTIKGSGATAGFAHLARFAHNMEEVFNLAREGRLAVTPELIDCGLKACDVIRLILQDWEESSEVSGEAEVTLALAQMLPAPESPDEDRGPESKPVAELRAAYEIIFKPSRDMFYSGADPVTLLDDLRELGRAHVTVHADQVPPVAEIESEHCYLWWEIRLVTDSDQAAIKGVFVFVEDDCEVHIRLLDDQASAVALFGSVPADTFEQFVQGFEHCLDAIERASLELKVEPSSRQHFLILVRSVDVLESNANVILGHMRDVVLKASHPLQLMLRMALGLESLLEPFRKATAGLPPEAAIETVLETCEAIRRQLGNLTDDNSNGEVCPRLLERLEVESGIGPILRETDVRGAAFLNTSSQFNEMIEGCFRRMEMVGEATLPILQTYLRGLKTMTAAAQYQGCQELEEPLAQQLQILNVAMSSGETLGAQSRSALHDAFREARAVMERTAAASASNAVPSAAVMIQPSANNLADRSATSPPATIRIDQNKLDRLMRVVGELLVARGAFPLLVQKLNEGADGMVVVNELKEAGSNISRIANELQTSVMSIRMLPVRTVFQRFPRLVRDLARSLGKEVQLVIEGEGIEMDKTILEQIGDPLVHLIRNAVDHGIELPDERRTQGKDPSGRLTLSARDQAGGVVIEVKEDGRGLDAGALKRKALEKGLITTEAAAAMSEEAAFQLVFLPGLTTAVKVTDVSGRGVGMDVVRSNIRNLHGTVHIQSKRGHGSSFQIKLPTSLMVSKGVLLRAGAQEYILPLSNIRDMVKLPLEDAHRYRGLALAQVRGTTYSIFNLAEMLGLQPEITPDLSVAIVEAGTVKYGLVVDKFLNEIEVLVKPLSGGLEKCKEFQGAAIMGDGRVVLVLNALECHSLERTECK